MYHHLFYISEERLQIPLSATQSPILFAPILVGIFLCSSTPACLDIHFRSQSLFLGVLLLVDGIHGVGWNRE